MSDWVHCNKCSLRYSSNVSFFLTECGHILCKKCTDNLSDSSCVVCSKSSKIILISNDMDPSIKEFFIPIETHLNKVIEVYKFQMTHQIRLFKMTLQKYNFAKKECISAFTKYREMAKENKMLRTMLMSAGITPNHQSFVTSTPLVNISQSDGASVVSSISVTPILRQGMRLGSSVMGSGIRPRIPSSGNGQFRVPQLPQHLSSGGSSLTRPSPSQLVPSMERNLAFGRANRSSESASSKEQPQQMRRAVKRT